MNDWKTSLTRYFKEGVKAAGEARLGVEVEHFILDGERRTAIPYAGGGGVREVLTRLMARYPEAESLPDDDFFGFRVPEFTITLEPAAQLEISIAPTSSVRRIGEIYQSFAENLNAVLAEFGYAAINAGCQPVSRVAELALIPKRRYDLMNAHFQAYGTGGMEMMRGTASLQVSIDYQSEADFRKKIQAAYYYAPVLKLFCDNSPSFQGVPLNTRLKRTDIWRRVDPSRCGILPGVFSASYGFADYAAFLGNMPPIFLKQGEGKILPTGARTIAELYDGRAPGADEIPHLLSMAFPDVRLKQYLEIRFADSVPPPFLLAYAALIKGLLYSEIGLACAQERIFSGEPMSGDDVRRAEDALMEQGWSAAVYGRPAGELAGKALELARRGLPESEREFLNAFDAVVRYGGIREIPRTARCGKPLKQAKKGER